MIMRRLNIACHLVFRYCLYLVFRFHSWHVVPLARKRYALDIIEYLNRRPTRGRKLETGS